MTPPFAAEDMAANKKYPGVRMRKWGKFVSEIKHPLSKLRIWLGTFNTAEEAYDVYYKKKIEFDALRLRINNKMNKYNNSDDHCVAVKKGESTYTCVGADNAGEIVNVENIGRPGDINVNKEGEGDGKGCGGSLQVPVGVEGRVKNFDSNGVINSEMSKDVVLPSGITMTRSGRWGVRVTDPSSKTTKWVRSYLTIVEAVVALNKRKAVLENNFNSKRKAQIFSEPTAAQKIPAPVVCYNSPTSVFESDNSCYSNITDDGQVDVPDAMMHGMAKDKLAIARDFDEAVRLGMINEYGELLGEFSVLDEPMWCIQDEDEALLGHL